MRRTTSVEWFKRNLQEIAEGNGKEIIQNVALRFTKSAKAGNYTTMSDEEYVQLLNECESMALFWEQKYSLDYFSLFANALKIMKIDEESITKIAEIMADCCNKNAIPFIPEEELEGIESVVRGMAKEKKEPVKTFSYTPKEIYEYLSKQIHGQTEAVKAASMLLYNHTKGHKRNILFAGPTGCGKTEIWRVLKNMYPYIKIIDYTQITEKRIKMSS